MKSRSSLTLRTPPDVNVNRKGNLRFQLPDSVSPNIRRSVDQYVADVTVKYRNSLQTEGIKGAVNQGNRIKSKVRMEATRRQQRSDYLNLKRQGDELPRISDVPTTTSAVDIETRPDGAASLESLRQLITERKEYLEMSRNRKQKVRWYERVTRQSEQLLNFLRANDKSAGDNYINNPANLVLTRRPAAAEPMQDPSGPRASIQSGAARQQLSAQATPGATEVLLDSKRQNNAIRATTTRKLSKRDSGSSSLEKDQGKLSRHMATTSSSDGESRQEDTRRGTSKNKSSLNTGGYDKENKGLRGEDFDNDHDVFQRITTGFRDSLQLNRPPGATATQNPTINGVSNNSIGFFKAENNSSTPNWKTAGVQPSSQPSGIKSRKRDMLKRSWNIMENEAKRCPGADMTGIGAWTSKLEAFGSAVGSGPMGSTTWAYTDAKGHPGMILKQSDSLWLALRKMWKKQDKGGTDELEPLSGVHSAEDDASKASATNPSKMLSRGRAMRRRRRIARATDDDSDYPVVPQGVLTSGPRRPFVIPEAPYEVEEAFSMDIINTGYDFIHNG